METGGSKPLTEELVRDTHDFALALEARFYSTLTQPVRLPCNTYSRSMPERPVCGPLFLIMKAMSGRWPVRNPADLSQTRLGGTGSAGNLVDVPSVAVEAPGGARIRVLDIAGLRHYKPAETAIIWDRKPARRRYNAIVPQDRRTAEACDQLRADGHNQKY